MFLCLQSTQLSLGSQGSGQERRSQALQLLAGQVCCSGGDYGSLQPGLGDAGSTSRSTHSCSVCPAPRRAAPADQPPRVPAPRALCQARRSGGGCDGRPEDAPFSPGLFLSVCGLL